MSHKPKTLLIRAVSIEKGASASEANVTLFSVEHKLAEPTGVIAALSKAFRAWYVAKPFAREYVDENGNNYGDATEIPDSFLEAQGVVSYTQASDCGEGEAVVLTYNDSITVDHDASLFDLGEADEFVDHVEGII